MSPRLMARVDAYETALATATQFFLKRDATPNVMHALHLLSLCKVASGQSALDLSARANR